MPGQGTQKHQGRRTVGGIPAVILRESEVLEYFLDCTRKFSKTFNKSNYKEPKKPKKPFKCTVCPGSSDPPEKILNIFASENEVYTIF